MSDIGDDDAKRGRSELLDVLGFCRFDFYVKTISIKESSSPTHGP